MGFVDGQETEDVKGIMGELLTRLSHLGATRGLCQIFLGGRADMGVGAASYDADVLKYVMDEMISEAGAEVIFHTKIIGAHMEDSCIDSVIIHNTAGIQLVKGRDFYRRNFSWVLKRQN